MYINVEINFDRLGSRRYLMCPLTFQTYRCILLCIFYSNGIWYFYSVLLLSGLWYWINDVIKPYRKVNWTENISLKYLLVQIHKDSGSIVTYCMFLIIRASNLQTSIWQMKYLSLFVISTSSNKYETKIWHNYYWRPFF